MAKKTFFQERTAREIEDLRVSRVSSPRDLVRRIDSLSFDDAIELRTRIIPGKFFINTQTGDQASRKCYKHGDLIALSQPRKMDDALRSRAIPLAVRTNDLKKLREMREEEINYLGYSFVPVMGRDRTKRVIPFVWLPEAIRLFTYCENMQAVGEKQKPGIIVHPYADSARVRKEGASVAFEVPSRTEKKGRYEFKLVHVPTEGVTERRAVAYSLKPQAILDEETGEPKTSHTLHDTYNIRYNWENAREESDRITFYPHQIAAYMKFAGEQWKNHNLVPMEMNQFALPSKHQADFYRKLCNNLVIYDPTLQGKTKHRKLHLAEKSILLARAIGVFGPEDFAYWDPARDGRLRDYDWSIPGER